VWKALATWRLRQLASDLAKREDDRALWRNAARIKAGFGRSMRRCDHAHNEIG
jgi:hypothetical protein